MDTFVRESPTRRDLLATGLLLGSGLVLGACSTSRDKGWKPMVSLPHDNSDLELPKAHPQNPHSLPESTPIPAAPSRPEGVLSRTSWTTGRPILKRADPMSGIARITVHHDGMPPVSLRSKSQVIRRIEAIRRSHVRKGWADIGYHYVIDPMGNVWEARPISLQGAHVKCCNEHNLGVMVLGNFQQQRPTAAAINALDFFLADRLYALNIPIPRLHTHQELAPTACPGRNLQKYMVQTRSKVGNLAHAWSVSKDSLRFRIQ